MTKKSVFFVLSILLTLSLAASASAVAEESPPAMADLWLVTPKEGHAADFRKALAEHMAFRTEHNDPRKWEVYTPMLGDNLGQYAIRYCCFSWADQDAYRKWQSEAGKISEHFDQNVAPHLDNAEHYFETLDLGNSHWVETGEPYEYFAVTEYFVKPGHGMAFSAAKEKMSQIALNHGWANDDRPWLWASTIGGEPQESIIVPHKNFASFEREGENFLTFLSRYMGEKEATDLIREFTNTSSRTQFQIWEYREELSMSSGE